MADHNLWRKNIPADFDGRMGDDWDDEVEVKPILWSAVAIAVSVAIAFAFCAWIISTLEDMRVKPVLSPIAEANERRLPPTPWLQPKPEVELEDMREELEHHLASYGWNDELEGMAHIPVDRAMDLVLAQYASGAVDSELDATVLAAGDDMADDLADEYGDDGGDSEDVAGAEAATAGDDGLEHDPGDPDH